MGVPQGERKREDSRREAQENEHEKENMWSEWSNVNQTEGQKQKEMKNEDRGREWKGWEINSPNIWL